jgi:hypothetical protein
LKKRRESLQPCLPSNLGISHLQATQRPPLTPGATGTLDLSTSPEMSGSRGGGDAVSLNWNHLPRVDVAENGLRERQHCPWREEFFKLIAILPREGRASHLPAPTVPLHAVLARIGRAAKRGCKYTDAGVTAAQLLLPVIHEIETRHARNPTGQRLTSENCSLDPSFARLKGRRRHFAGRADMKAQKLPCSSSRLDNHLLVSAHEPHFSPGRVCIY